MSEFKSKALFPEQFRVSSEIAGPGFQNKIWMFYSESRKKKKKKIKHIRKWNLSTKIFE